MCNPRQLWAMIEVTGSLSLINFLPECHLELRNEIEDKTRHLSCLEDSFATNFSWNSFEYSPFLLRLVSLPLWITSKIYLGPLLHLTWYHLYLLNKTTTVYLLPFEFFLRNYGLQKKLYWPDLYIVTWK